MRSKDAILSDPAQGMKRLALELYAALPNELARFPKNDLGSISRRVDGLVGRHETYDLRAAATKKTSE